MLHDVSILLAVANLSRTSKWHRHADAAHPRAGIPLERSTCPRPGSKHGGLMVLYDLCSLIYG